MTVYSHPPEGSSDGVLLRDHLASVADRVDHVVDADSTTPAGEEFAAVVRTLARVHDLGKATTFFQRYINDDRDDPDPALRQHSPLGAVAAYYALDCRGFDTETCLAGFVAVAKHHGRLPNVATYVHERTHRREGVDAANENKHERRQSRIAEQIVDIQENAPALGDELITAATDGDADWAAFSESFFDVLDELSGAVAAGPSGVTVDTGSLSSSCYGLVLRCWSALVLADKTDAARAPSGSDTYAAEQPTFDRLDEYVGELEAAAEPDADGSRRQRLDHYRSRARSSVLDNAERFADGGGGVATLTLPTGMGKTLTGLSAALSIRDQLDDERVIYALPFTSVIDQVVDELTDIYDADTAGRLITAHHHLSETTIQEDDPESADLDDDVAGMLAESWRAGLTVTTFVQLFESLAGPQNTQSMKLPALRDSVIVLDEPQSLPIDWWRLAPRLLGLLTEQYDATVIAMTATQPRLFEWSDAVETPTELVDDAKRYFEAVERVGYELDESTERYIDQRNEGEPKKYADASSMLRTAADGGGSTLVICNTIDSARELTEHVDDPTFVDVAAEYEALLGDGEVDPETLAERVDAAGNQSLLHLSTRLRPTDRLTLIEAAKALTQCDHALVTVSTQLVEAGVDISFDRVYRDLAPVDSVVQAAGRCNRSFERDRGIVTVWWLDSPADSAKTPAEAVYNRGTALLPPTAETLASVRDENGLGETDVARTAVEDFYRRLHEEKAVGKQEYADWVDSAKSDDLAELSLIDQRRAADVLICRTDADRECVEAIREAHANYEFDRLDSLIETTKPMRVSVPLYRHDDQTTEAIESLPSVIADEGLYELDVVDHPGHFDTQQGFVVPDDTVEHRLL